MYSKGRKAVLTYRLYTLKGKPSRVNKETENLRKYDAEIHRAYLIFTKYLEFSSLSECEKSKEFSSTPSELNILF